MFKFDIAGITPRDIENHNKTFNFNVVKLFTGSSGGGEAPVNGRYVTSLDMPSGGCWWNTEFIVNQDTEIRCTCMNTSSYIRYVYSDSTNTVQFMTSGGGTGKFGGVSASLNTMTTSLKCAIIQNKSGVSCNDTFKAYTNVPDFTSKYNLALGAHGISGNSAFEGSLYGFQILQAGELVLNWRPFVDADGVPCFYDTVSKTNKYNLGTGTLTFTE